MEGLSITRETCAWLITWFQSQFQLNIGVKASLLVPFTLQKETGFADQLLRPSEILYDRYFRLRAKPLEEVEWPQCVALTCSHSVSENLSKNNESEKEVNEINNSTLTWPCSVKQILNRPELFAQLKKSHIYCDCTIHVSRDWLVTHLKEILYNHTHLAFNKTQCQYIGQYRDNILQGQYRSNITVVTHKVVSLCRSKGAGSPG